MTDATIYNHLNDMKLTPNKIIDPLSGEDVLERYKGTVTIKDLMHHYAVSEKRLVRMILIELKARWKSRRIKLPHPQDIREWKIAAELIDNRRATVEQIEEVTSLKPAQIRRYMKRIEK